MRGGGLLGHFSIFSFTNGLVKKQKGESHNGGDKKTTHVKSSEKSEKSGCVSRGKKCSFFE